MSAEDVEGVEELLGGAETRVNPNEMALFAASGVFVALLTAHVAVNIRGVALTEIVNLAVLAVVSVAVVVALVYAYNGAAQAKKVRLLTEPQPRSKGKTAAAANAKLSKKDRAALNRAQQEREQAQVDAKAQMYSLGSINSLFLAAFVVLQAIVPFPALYTYAIANALAAAGVAYIASLSSSTQA